MFVWKKLVKYSWGQGHRTVLQLWESGSGSKSHLTLFGILAVQEYRNSDDMLPLQLLIKKQTFVLETQNCFSSQVVLLCDIDCSMSFLHILNLLPHSNAEACIFLVTPQRLWTALTVFVSFCVCWCLLMRLLKNFFNPCPRNIKDFCYCLEKHL